MCTYPVQTICTFSCTSVFFINIYYPQYTVLHILSHCTSYTFYFIICSLFHSHLYLYIYSLVLCFIVLLLMLFLCSILFLFLFYFLHFPLSRPVPTYISLLIIPCMIVYVTNNKEPWTLRQMNCLGTKYPVLLSAGLAFTVTWQRFRPHRRAWRDYLFYDL